MTRHGLHDAADETGRSATRLVSLDALRGLTVLGMVLVNSAAALHYGVEATVFPTLLHVPWSGLTLADLMFPGFLMMMGVSIPLALRGRAGTPGQVGRILWRTARIVLLGLLLSNLSWLRDFSSGEWRPFGVLQRIGVAYGAAALLFLFMGMKARLALIAIVLVAYWPLTLLPALDGLPTDIWVRGHNFVAYVDRAVAGVHNYVKGPEGYDPEGLLSTLPAIAHALIGVAIGELLVRAGPDRASRPLLLAGAAMLGVGLAWGLVFPVVKDIWSSSFVLVTSGITTLALAGLHAWLDRAEPSSGATRWIGAALTAVGVNAIAAYTLHMVTADMATWQALLLPFGAMRGALGDPIASLFPIALYLLFIWACTAWLRRRGWIVKI